MGEPDFLSQTAEPMTPAERSMWFQARAREARASGAAHMRATVHPDDENLLLFEAWKVRPDDEGEPRFQFSPQDPTHGQ
jgi:hypothetical protein